MRRLLTCLFLILICESAAFAGQSLTVGSKRFAESMILGEMITQIANRTGEAVAAHKEGLGNTGIVFAALKNGDIDLYPEYTGTIALELLKDKTTPDVAKMNRQLAPLGLTAGLPFGFNDTYALAVREDVAQRLGLTSISDLARHPELKLGLSQEFINRADGWPGLKAAYGLPFSEPQGIDHGLAYEAVSSGQVDVIDIYSTDSKISRYKLRVLTDDRQYFPSYNALLLYKSNLPARLPKTWAALQVLNNSVTAAQMIVLNGKVELDHQTATTVAANFLATNLRIGKTVTEARGSHSLWARIFAPDLAQLTGQHLFLVFVSLLLSIAAGVPLGIAAARNKKLAGPILSTVGVIQTIPSLALLAFLIPLLSIGDKPTIVALFLYSLLPIVRNTYAGLIEIAPSLRESAIALGLPPGARLRLIELPLAARTIFAGIKTAAVINVGTATIAAFIGAGGYGERIKSGLDTLDNSLILAGAIPAAVLALLVQMGFDLLDRAVVPAGLRNRDQ